MTKKATPKSEETKTEETKTEESVKGDATEAASPKVGPMSWDDIAESLISIPMPEGVRVESPQRNVIKVTGPTTELVKDGSALVWRKIQEHRASKAIKELPSVLVQVKAAD